MEDENESQALTTIVTSTALDVLMYSWLAAKKTRSGSDRTLQAYRETLLNFRQMLNHEGLDLDYQEEEELYKIGLLAQAFSVASKRGKPVRPTTINQRLAILSSFYQYAIQKRVLKVNPLITVERSKVQPYGKTRAIAQSEVEQALSQIDRSQLAGKRNYALLVVFLGTGRRLTEVAELQLCQLSRGNNGTITLTFAAKGDKTMIDTLSIARSNALKVWLDAFYGESWSLEDERDARPVWVALNNDKSEYGKPLSKSGVVYIVEKHLGTTKVHRLRHTWAHSMDELGAPVTLIQKQLGHSSLQTTGIYLESLRRPDNPFGDDLDKHLGIT